jgi:[acyl-carrier-protein] S-malonyltransferase
MEARSRAGVIFPGQGSQVVGMGSDVAANSPAARDLFERSAKIVGYDLLAVCREGPEDRLRETRFSQPAIFVTNCALAVAANLSPVVSAGHSFGEYCSLVLAGSLAFEDALELVNARGIAMQRAAEIAAGGMSAILGLDSQKIEVALNQAQAEGAGCVSLANFNSPTQIVISGDLAAVRRAGDLCLEAGAKRVVALNVSGAWHSELMRPALPLFSPVVERARVEMPRFPVISNVDAQAYRDVAHIKTNLIKSLTAEVLWHATAMKVIGIDGGIDLVVEFGASPVLVPMLKRLEGVPETASVSDDAGVLRLQSRLGALTSR